MDHMIGVGGDELPQISTAPEKPLLLPRNSIGAAKRRRRENPNKLNNVLNGERRLRSEIHVISASKCISPLVDSGSPGSRGAKRKWDENNCVDFAKDSVAKSDRKRWWTKRKSLDSSNVGGGSVGVDNVSKGDNTGKGDTAAHKLHSESNVVQSSKSQRRRRRDKRRRENGDSACNVIPEEGVEPLNNKSPVPVVERSCAVEGDESAVPKAVRSGARKKLLVLDLNGLLCDVVHGYPRTDRAHERVGRSAVFKRPFCDDFMKFCCERFEIGVWSSRLLKNVEGVVNYIMKDIKDNLLFCWDASKCTYTGFQTIEDKKKPLVLKQLKKLWNKEGDDLTWEKGDYSPSNTLLVDDSPYKALCNPPHTSVFPYPYHYMDEKDNSLGPGGDLRDYLEGLALADDVQCYVREHPFGRRAITNANSSWKFYEQVINKIEQPIVTLCDS